MNDGKIEKLNRKRVMFGSGERDYSVDVMRCISCLLVVVVHNASAVMNRMPLDETGVVSDVWLSAAMVKCISVSATNLFLMISGIFFLSPERNVTPVKLWSKNILKLSAAYVVWSIIYALLRIYYLNPRPFTAELLLEESLIQDVHLWYIPMMVGIYILVPLMRPFTQIAGKKHYQYMIGIMIGAMALNTVYTFNDYYIDYPAATQLTTILGYTTPMTMICQYPFYCILGYYLYTYPPKLKTRIIYYILGFAGVIGLFVVTVFVYKVTGDCNPGGLHGKFVLGVFFKNTALFVLVITLFDRVRFGNAAKKIISKLSAATLFIYLYHFVPIDIFFKEQWMFVDGMPTMRTVAINVVVIYVGGFIVSLLILQLIPWVRMRNIVLDAVWPNRRIWVTRNKKVTS